MRYRLANFLIRQNLVLFEILVISKLLNVTHAAYEYYEYKDEEVKGYTRQSQVLLPPPIGKTMVFLNGECHRSECNLGNLIADSFVEYKSNVYTGSFWTDAAIAVVSSDMIKSSINASARGGAIYVDDLEHVMPIDAKLVTLKLKGMAIRRALATAYDFIQKMGNPQFLQVSGIRVVYDPHREPGQKLVSVKVRNFRWIPTYGLLDRQESYHVVCPEKLVTGIFAKAMEMGEAEILNVESITARQAVRSYIEEQKIMCISNGDRIMRKIRIVSGINGCRDNRFLIIITLVAAVIYNFINLED